MNSAICGAQQETVPCTTFTYISLPNRVPHPNQIGFDSGFIRFHNQHNKEMLMLLDYYAYESASYCSAGLAYRYVDSL
jgi:hypothetical protein